jgi:hypothetical protein
MRISIPLVCLTSAFLIGVPLLAQADPARDEHRARATETPEDRLDARFARALELRVGEVLDRRVDLATSRAVASLEDREAERLGQAGVEAPRRAGPSRSITAPASSGRGAVAVRWTALSRAAGRCAWASGY